MGKASRQQTQPKNNMKDTVRKLQSKQERVRDSKIKTAILDNLTDRIVAFDLDGNVLYLNDAATNICECQKTLSKGKSSPYSYERTFIESIEPRLKELIKIKQLLFFNTRCNKNGKIITSELHSRIIDHEGQPIILVIDRDCSELSRISEELKKANEAMHAMIEQAPLAIFSLDKNKVVKRWNPAAERILGLSKDEVIGHEFLLVPEDQKIKFADLCRQVYEGKSLAGIMMRRTKKDGTTIDLNISSTPLFDSSGQVSEVMIFAHDITWLSRAEEELMIGIDKLQRTLDEAVIALSSTAEKRDPYTAGHQERVSKLACAIANEMSLPKSKLDAIRIAGLMHDIGKISIPAEVLSKPTKLSELEFEMIKCHCIDGYEILKSIEFPWPIADMVVQHHERLDGRGYPAGLKGEDILLEARILAVADVVEAMASHRPYRAAVGIDKALEEIKDGNGTRYDSAAAEACIKLFKKKKYSFEY